MSLFFCPTCRKAFPAVQSCSDDNVLSDDVAKDYVEKLLETVLSEETNRAGMAVDVLTKWLHEPRALVPLTMLLERKGDPYPLVLGARGLGWLKNAAAIPALEKLLLDEEQPYVARIAAAEALGQIGGEDSRYALEQAKQSPRPSVVYAAHQALHEIERER
jgi:HEAT repeat protein